MSIKSMYTTLYDFLVDWLTDAELREQYDDNLEHALEDNGFDDVDAHDIVACLPLIAEDLPPQYQQAIYEELNAMAATDAGSTFEVNQGRGDTGAVQDDGAGSDGGSHDSGHSRGDSDGNGRGDHGDGDMSPMDAVVHHVKNIQHVTENNYSWIDDRDVSTTVSALGDVDFDQVVASGDGAVAADGDVMGVNTGENSGVIAGDDVDDVEVTNVDGDRNVTGDLGEDATAITGDGNIVADESQVVGGDVDGAFIGGDVNADHSALNFGDGDVGQDNSVDASTNDSFNRTWTDKSDNSANDSFNRTWTDKSDNSTDTDLDVKVDDSFQDNDDYSTDRRPGRRGRRLVPGQRRHLDADRHRHAHQDRRRVHRGQRRARRRRRRGVDLTPR